MKQTKITGIGMTGVRVELNLTELRQMSEMKERVAQVLDSHKDKEKKNEYLKDDELLMIQTILTVLTCEYSNNEVSAFNEALKELKEQKQEQPETPVDAVEVAQADEHIF